MQAGNEIAAAANPTGCASHGYPCGSNDHQEIIAAIHAVTNVPDRRLNPLIPGVAPVLPNRYESRA